MEDVANIILRKIFHENQVYVSTNAYMRHCPKENVWIKYGIVKHSDRCYHYCEIRKRCQDGNVIFDIAPLFSFYDCKTALLLLMLNCSGQHLALFRTNDAEIVSLGKSETTIDLRDQEVYKRATSILSALIV
jgi:hypothetical protein